VKWRDTIDNVVMTEGKNLAFDSFLAESAEAKMVFSSSPANEAGSHVTLVGEEKGGRGREASAPQVAV
jgi:hypothetical protein